MRKDAKQWEQTLDYILEFKRLHGYFPRQADIAQSFGVSRQRVHQIFTFLIENRHIKVEGGLLVKVLRRDANKKSDKAVATRGNAKRH